MSSQPSIDEAISAADSLSASLGALRERFLADDRPPPGMPRVLSYMIAHATNVRGHVSQGKDDMQANKAAMERTIADLEERLRETQVSGEQRSTQDTTTINELKEANTQFTADRVRLESLAASKQVVVDALQEERGRLNGSIRQSRQLSQRVADLERQIGESETASQTLRTELADAKESYRSLDNEWIERYNTLVDKFNTHKRHHQDESNRLRVERNQIRRDLEIQEDRERDIIRQEAEKWEAEIQTRLQAQGMSHREEVEAAIRRTTAVLKEEHRKLLEATRKAVTDRVTADAKYRRDRSLERVKQSAAKDMQASETAHDIAVKKLEASIAEKDRMLKELQASKAETSETVEQLRASNNTKDATVAALRTSLTATESQVKELHISLGKKKTIIDDFYTSEVETSTLVESLQSSMTTLEENIDKAQTLLATKEDMIQKLQASKAELTDVLEDVQSSITEKDDKIQTLQTSLDAKDREVIAMRELSAKRETELNQEHASVCKSMQTTQLETVSKMNKEHQMQMDILWKQISQLKSRDYVSSAAQTLAQDECGAVPVSTVGLVGKSTSADTTENSTGTEYIYINDSDEEMGDLENDSASFSPRSKRPLVCDSETRIVKKTRELSPQSSGAEAEIRDLISGDTPTRSTPQDADVGGDANDDSFVLWKMFVCAWDISTVEMQILLRQFDRVFTKGRDIEAVIQRIELHIVGTFKQPPVYPRCCLFADLRSSAHGNGGSTLAKSCPYCKVDSQNRICVWASYVPGVQPTYGGRVGGEIPAGEARQYNRGATPWTALGASNARWVLHKRRTEPSMDVVNPWDVNGIRITFDTDPLGN